MGRKMGEGMGAAGLTAGCLADPLTYCPWVELPREQAAVFGLRMKYGKDYTPPAASGTLFDDMTDTEYWGDKMDRASLPRWLAASLRRRSADVLPHGSSFAGRGRVLDRPGQGFATAAINAAIAMV